MVTGSISSLVNNASPSTIAPNTKSVDYKMEFLKLMMVQLRNQDPTKPFDSSQMLTQQAQFASLEQMQNLNTNLLTLLAMQNVSQATNMLGKTVQGVDVEGTSVTGTISGVRFIDGETALTVALVGGTTTLMKLPAVASVTP